MQCMHPLGGYVAAMAEQATLNQRLTSLFSKPDTKVTLKDLLQAVPDINERSSWRFFFALCSMMTHLEQGTKEYQEGYWYYWRYVNSGRSAACCLKYWYSLLHDKPGLT
jgi:hypothetical protein